ncbi:hypothetical protein PCK2_001018 [Pneumocystis canis]|nr:hypothetical protein PCK2_001018 [Pneumocystis canis]
MPNSPNFLKKSLWENFPIIENNKRQSDLKNRNLKESKIEDVRNDNETVINVNVSPTTHLNSVQNHNLKCNFFSKDYFITKEGIVSLFSSISNYRKKLLDKKTYISQTSKYFLIKYLKGKKQTNKCYSDPLKLDSFYFTRFPIHIEYSIYHLAHIKLSNPHRPLYQQVLLTNFMYSYLSLINKDQIISKHQNELHECNYLSSVPKYSFTSKSIPNQPKKTMEFQIKKTDKESNRNKYLINDDIDFEYEPCTPYLINSLDPTIFNYNNLNIPFTYDNYDKNLNDMYSISNNNDYLYYNRSDLDRDILDPNIPMIRNIHNTLYI